MSVLELHKKRRLDSSDRSDPAVWEVWPSLMTSANEFFEQGHFERARHTYQDCVALTHCYFESWPTPDGALSAALVSGVNMMAASVALGEIDAAREQLCETHCFIIGLVRDAHLSLDLRVSAHKVLGRSVFELKRFRSDHGDSQELAFWIANSCVCPEWRQVQAELKEQASAASGRRLH